MARSNTTNKRVNLYINGKEAATSIKEVKAEMQKLVNEQARLKLGSDEYIAHAKKIKMLKGIIQEHNDSLKTTHTRWLSLSGITNGFNTYFGMVTSFLAGLTGIVLGFRKCGDEAGKFEENLSNLSALTGLAGENLEWLSNKAKEMSITTTKEGINIKQSATDILDAFTKMGSQRPELLKNKEALAAVTEDAIILSEAAKMQLEPAAASLANVMNQFNAKSSDSRRIINELAAGSQAGAGDIQYLSDAIEKCGTTAYLMGIQTNQAVGLIEAVAPKFKEASMAGNSLDKVLLKLKEKQIGFKTGTFDINQALEELETRIAKGESSATIFGVEPAKMAEVLIQAKEDINRYTNAVTGSEKAIEMAAKNTNNRMAERAQAMNRLKLQMIEVGEKISPAITIGTNTFTYFLKALTKAPGLFKENKEIIVPLASAILALSGKTLLASTAIIKNRAALLLDTVAKQKNALVTAFLTEKTNQYNITQGRLHPALLKARTAFVMLNRAMVANPIGAITIAFTALRSALTYYDRNNEESIRLEREKTEVMNTLKTSNEKLSEQYKSYNTQISRLNTLSRQEKLDLREKIALAIQSAKAELELYKTKQLNIKKENTTVGTWDITWKTLTTFKNPFAPQKGIERTFDKLKETARKKGEEAAAELDPGINKIQESINSMEQDLKQLDNIFNAESSADKIGSSTITQLEEKINLYKIALDNATRESEEFYRVQTKLVNTQKALNEAIKNRDYTTESEDKATEKENAKKLQAAEALAKKKKEIEEQLAKKIQEINNQVQISSLKEDEKEIMAAHNKFQELLSICQKYNLDATELYEAHHQEISFILDKQLEKGVTATIEAEERIQAALSSSSEKQKNEIQKRYSDLLALAQQHGIDTDTIRQQIQEKMDRELKNIQDPGGMQLFNITEEEWEEFEEKMNMALDLAGQLNNIWGQFNEFQNNRDKKELQDYEKNTNKKKELLNKQLDSGRISQEKYNAQVAQLDADLDKKKTEIARKQAKREKAQAIAGVITNTATAIMRIWADVPKFDFGISTGILTAIAAATGAAQLSTIIANPLPEYAQGGMTDGARVYIAGEAGREWIAPNNMLNDPITGPIIQQLELVRSGILSPEQLRPILPDFSTMTSIPMYATGGLTGPVQNTTNFYQTSTEDTRLLETVQGLRDEIRIMNTYLSDPRNRQAYISNDVLIQNEKEMNLLNYLKQL